MMKQNKGTIHIGRVTDGSKEGDYIIIELDDGTSHTRIANIKLSLEEFGDAVSGRGYVGCSFTINDSLVGYTYEHKTELVEFKPTSYNREKRKEAAKKALKKLEKDGWVGSVDDLLNHHRWSTGDKYSVVFHRYVKP